MIRFVFTGSRQFTDRSGHRVAAILKELRIDSPAHNWGVDVEFMHGGADGFDLLVHAALRKARWPLKQIFVKRPDYDGYPRHQAPLIRNQQMVDWALEGGRAVVVAMLPYPTPSRGGTLATVRYALKSGAELRVYRWRS